MRPSLPLCPPCLFLGPPDLALAYSDFIGQATLIVYKEASEFPCSGHTIKALHADFECCTPGAGVRRMREFDPPVTSDVDILHAPDGQVTLNPKNQTPKS